MQSKKLDQELQLSKNKGNNPGYDSDSVRNGRNMARRCYPTNALRGERGAAEAGPLDDRFCYKNNGNTSFSILYLNHSTRSDNPLFAGYGADGILSKASWKVTRKIRTLLTRSWLHMTF